MSKNFKENDHRNLLHCPFPDESYNLPRHQIAIQKDLNIAEENDGTCFLHQHPLILVIDTQTFHVNSSSILLHNPKKKIQLLCDGCVKPITEMPFYKCSKDFGHCGFVLHEWCARLPSEIKDHPVHDYHTLFLMLNNVMKTKLYGVFVCKICLLPSNGFAYGCKKCDYYVDINCAFLPKNITHEALPGHQLFRISRSFSLWHDLYKGHTPCNACGDYLIRPNGLAYSGSSYDFYLHTECALLLPRMIRHKHDKHPLSLRYEPVENHPGDYFCAICEDEFDPTRSWFYHCGICVESMHTSCAPIILQCEQAVFAKYKRSIFEYINVKFGGTLKIESHPHLLTFVQGMACHGKCKECDEELQYEMMFKCLECEYTLHYQCALKTGQINEEIERESNNLINC